MLSSGQASGETCPKLSPRYHRISKVPLKYCHSPLVATLYYSEATLLGNRLCNTGEGSVLVEVGVRFMEPVHSVFPSAVLSPYVDMHDSGEPLLVLEQRMKIYQVTDNVQL